MTHDGRLTTDDGQRQGYGIHKLPTGELKTLPNEQLYTVTSLLLSVFKIIAFYLQNILAIFSINIAGGATIENKL